MYEVSVPDEALTDEDEDILNYDEAIRAVEGGAACLLQTGLDVYKRQAEKRSD